MQTELYLNLNDDIKEIRKDIKDLRQEITRYKGFIGGVLWAAGALSVGAQFLITWIKKGGF